jgi:hypothetical protein
MEGPVERLFMGSVGKPVAVPIRKLLRHAHTLWMCMGVVLVLLAAMSVCFPAVVNLQITEFMAVNNETLIDDDDDRSDWIEIHNPSKYDVDLDGWYLTDDPADLIRWPFPSIVLPSRGYVVVFASGKDRRAPGAPLHTNFKLTAEGEYLGLISPGFVPVSEFFPEYPKQDADVSYGVAQEEGPEEVGYFETPTPGMQNGPAFAGVAGRVRFSVPSSTFTKSVSLTLSLPDDAGDSAVICYTTDGSIPTESSTLYTRPLSISTTKQVRARVFQPGWGKGHIVSETYIGLESEILTFTSNLPLVVLETFGGGSISDYAYETMSMAIFEPGSGRSSLLNPPDLAVRGGIKVRGSSTVGRPKASFGVETWNEENEDKNVSPLGMPAESDWVLWGPYNFDLALMRNPFIYELSNQIGQYAARGRFVEVFLNTGGGRLSNAHYWGVYAFMEKISRDEDRVNVERLFPEHDREPGVTGGYILKIDRLDPGDQGFSAAGQTLCYVYPKEIDIEQPERDPQEQYIRGFMNEMGYALNGTSFTDPDIGYRKYVDVDAAVDHHLLNILTKNPDALRLSTYMYKRRGGKLIFGPIWDFDRTMGSTDGRDADPTGWYGGTDFFNYPWWGRMFQDSNFFQRYIDRWQELRKDHFSVENIHSIIDHMADEIREAQVRDLQKWGQMPRSQYGGTFQGEVDHLKDWLATRCIWMDEQFVPPPVFSSAGGKITSGFTFTMTAPAGATIFYTLDGSDPRLPGGKVSKLGQTYIAPVPLTDTTEIVARTRMPNSKPNPNYNVATMSDWSGPTKARFSIHTLARAGNLVITEINYNPLDPMPDELLVNPNFVKDDFEFIELKNVGTTTIDLIGVEFTNGIRFSFRDSEVTTLRAGEIVLLVKNRAAFQARYGNVNNIAGEYAGGLDNGGETLRLVDASGQNILKFEYQDEWYPTTDGMGFSLVILNEHASSDAWGDKASWRTSTLVGGSPQQNDPTPPGIPPIVINEVLSNAELPQTDVIELYNPTIRDVDIGGWFLTDSGRIPQRFRIPGGTVIPAGGYLTFDETDFNTIAIPKSSRFSLGSTGEEVYLYSADADGNLSGYCHGFSFGASEVGTTFGRHVISTGAEHFVTQVTPTLNKVNAGPKVGPVVINEIMSSPAYDGGEGSRDYQYLELRNVASEPVPLFDSNFPANTWRIEGAVDYTFPPGVTLLAGENLLVVGFNPDTDPEALFAFRKSYRLGTDVTILGPYSGTLEISGEEVALSKPDATGAGGDSAPYVLLDRVDYSFSPPWPGGANGGQSLQRLVSSGYGNDPLNWQAAAPTPGADNAGGGNLDVDEDGLPNDWESAHGLDPLDGNGEQGAGGDPDNDGQTNLQEYLSGTHPRDPGSFLRVDSISTNATAVVVRFTAIAGKTYSVLYRDALAGGDWAKLSDVPAQVNTDVIEVHDPGAVSVGARFYRLVTPQLP